MLAGIGDTPLVRLSKLVEPGLAEVWVKLEAANPTGSYKDRMALAMIEGAERDGRLKPGQPVVEYTGGSTGSSLAFVCAVKGYPLHIVTSDAFADEKLRTMEAFGALARDRAEPHRHHAAADPTHARSRRGARAGGRRPPDRSVPQHRHGRRLPKAGRGDPCPAADPIDALCLYVGTAGCFLGVSQTLRARDEGMHRVAVEPGESAVLSGGQPGTHRIEGGGTGFMPDLLTADDFDEAFPVMTADAFAMARRATRQEGLFSGPSTGANITAALELARRVGPDGRVVTIQVDSGLKYLGGGVYRDVS